MPRKFLFADIDGAPPKATGLALYSIPLGAAAMNAIFLGPALLCLAEDTLVCKDGGSSCWVYGMRPTLLLTNIGAFGGLLLSTPADGMDLRIYMLHFIG